VQADLEGNVGAPFGEAARGHEDQPWHLGWERQRVGRREQAAQRVADWNDLLDAQTGHELVELADVEISGIVEVGGLGGIAVAGIVDRKAVVPGFREGWVVVLEVAVAARARSTAMEE
jgi:hypothetical protein